MEAKRDTVQLKAKSFLLQASSWQHFVTCWGLLAVFWSIARGN